MPTTTVSASVCVGRKLFTKSPKTKDSLNTIAKCELQSHLANSNNRSDKSLLFCFFNLHSALCIEPLRLT